MGGLHKIYILLVSYATPFSGPYLKEKFLKTKLLSVIAAIALSTSLTTSTAIAADSGTFVEQTTAIAGTAGGTGIDRSDPFIAARLGQPIRVAMADGTTSDAPMQLAAGPNEPTMLAAAPAGAKPAAKPSTGPSTGQRVFWGVVGATAANLLTGGISGMAWAFHALVTAGGGYVGATTVADKMK